MWRHRKVMRGFSYRDRSMNEVKAWIGLVSPAVTVPAIPSPQFINISGTPLFTDAAQLGIGVWNNLPVLVGVDPFGGLLKKYWTVILKFDSQMNPSGVQAFTPPPAPSSGNEAVWVYTGSDAIYALRYCLGTANQYAVYGIPYYSSPPVNVIRLYQYLPTTNPTDINIIVSSIAEDVNPSYINIFFYTESPSNRIVWMVIDKSTGNQVSTYEYAISGASPHVASIFYNNKLFVATPDFLGEIYSNTYISPPLGSFINLTSIHADNGYLVLSVEQAGHAYYLTDQSFSFLTEIGDGASGFPFQAVCTPNGLLIVWSDLGATPQTTYIVLLDYTTLNVVASVQVSDFVLSQTPYYKATQIAYTNDLIYILGYDTLNSRLALLVLDYTLDIPGCTRLQPYTPTIATTSRTISPATITWSATTSITQVSENDLPLNPSSPTKTQVC